jgi:hypothetical protein
MTEQRDESNVEFVWRGKVMRTLGDLIDAIVALTSREQAQEFIAAYRETTPHADENAGYITGYLDADQGAELREWMGTPHPIFGMRTATPREAFLAGVARGAGADDDIVKRAFE